MGIFRFKKFEVVNEKSAMKVNTDGVLLGALMTICPSDRHLLDIGTGTGTIALMTAQRLAMMQEGRKPMVRILGTLMPSMEAAMRSAFRVRKSRPHWLLRRLYCRTKHSSMTTRMM